MLRAVGVFLIFQLGYHILVTIFDYGMGRIDQSTLAMLRDGAWILLTLIIFLLNTRHRKPYFQQWRKVFCAFGAVLIFGILTSFFLSHKGISDILIGIKYGLWRMLILLTASGIGFFSAQQKTNLTSATKRIKRSLLIIVLLGRIRQLAKLLFPDFFFSLGYGKLDNFHFGSHPPIYYLTGENGILRRQGLFAGPNNYGYFLVLFLPLILHFFRLRNPKRSFNRLKTQRQQSLVLLLWFITLGATLSRAALVGAVIVLMLTQFSFLKKNKKLMRGLGIVCCLGLLGFSVLKRDSTIAHLAAKFNGLLQVTNHPLGFGLGSSWPAVHHSGNLLPENYYLQLMLDLGTVGFLLRCGVMLLLGRQQKQLHHSFRGDLTSEEWQSFRALQRGMLAFLVMGLFLHVFEDSMVNYLFFIPYGCILGYLSAQLPSQRGYSSNIPS